MHFTKNSNAAKQNFSLSNMVRFSISPLIFVIPICYFNEFSYFDVIWKFYMPIFRIYTVYRKYLYCKCISYNCDYVASNCNKANFLSTRISNASRDTCNVESKNCLGNTKINMTLVSSMILSPAFMIWGITNIMFRVGTTYRKRGLIL